MNIFYLYYKIFLKYIFLVMNIYIRRQYIYLNIIHYMYTYIVDKKNQRK